MNAPRQSAEPSEPVVEVEDIHLSFEDKEVLKGVTFTVRQGETVALLAESGGGKTVLLKVILGLETPDSGSVRLFGTEVLGRSDDDEELDAIRRRMGVVYQSGALYSGLTVEENVALELREVLKLPEEEIRERVKKSIDAVSLGEIDPGLKPDELSGGMKKRLAVARALAVEPEAVFYDEPTSGLDPVNSARVLALIGKLGESYGVTSILVTHDVRGALDICDRIVFLLDGRVGFDGPPEEFAESKDPVIAEYIAAAPGMEAACRDSGTRRRPSGRARAPLPAAEAP